MKYLFFDPGEHTGYAGFSKEGSLTTVGTCQTPEELFEFLARDLEKPEFTGDLELILYESFRLYPWKSEAQYWSEFKTVQVIGAIKYRAFDMGIEVKEQPSNILNMGYRYMGMDPLPHSNPLNHQFCAIAHGVYYLQINGIRKPQQEI